MPISADNSESLRAYRAATLALNEFSFVVEKTLEEAGGSGELGAAKEALAELRLRTEAFEELRATLSPLDLFIAKYGVVALDEHTVSFVIPQGVSRVAILKEAQKISIELHEANPKSYSGNQAICPDQLIDWESDSSFIEVPRKTLLQRIDGNVEGSTNMTRAEQEEKGWNNVALQDLAIAHSVFYLLTGEDLFKGNVVRAFGGALYFSSNGLVVISDNDDFRHGIVSASRSLPVPN